MTVLTSIVNGRGKQHEKEVNAVEAEVHDSVKCPWQRHVMFSILVVTLTMLLTTILFLQQRHQEQVQGLKDRIDRLEEAVWTISKPYRDAADRESVRRAMSVDAAERHGGTGGTGSDAAERHGGSGGTGSDAAERHGGSGGRSRRDAPDPRPSGPQAPDLGDNLLEDGHALPAVDGSYGNAYGNSEGLRIYDSWVARGQAIPRRRNRPLVGSGGGSAIDLPDWNRYKVTDVEDAASELPIQPHHRISAAYIDESNGLSGRPTHDLNPHFDDKIFRGHYVVSQEARAAEAATSTTLPPPPAAGSDILRSAHFPAKRHKSSAAKRRKSSAAAQTVVTTSTQNATLTAMGARNRASVRAGDGGLPVSKHPKRKHHRGGGGGGGSIASRFTGLAAIHYVAQASASGSAAGDPAAANTSDGVFRSWSPARWAARMRSTLLFPIDDDGKVRVSKPGIYYIYAQINYLDKHDVNGFQVYVNAKPFLLCTAMTHTGHGSQTTKANTCFSAGTIYLEQGDAVYVRDLEPERQSVLLPAHTFFGLVQLSTIGI